jgi:hypothetical protein
MKIICYTAVTGINRSGHKIRRVYKPGFLEIIEIEYKNERHNFQDNKQENYMVANYKPV